MQAQRDNSMFGKDRKAGQDESGQVQQRKQTLCTPPGRLLLILTGFRI